MDDTKEIKIKIKTNIMTPQEKAKELISTYSLGIFAEMGHELMLNEVKAIAKRSALIAVDELINAHNGIKDFLFKEIGYLITTPEYWQEVKNEIEKL